MPDSPETGQGKNRDFHNEQFTCLHMGFELGNKIRDFQAWKQNNSRFPIPKSFLHSPARLNQHINAIIPHTSPNGPPNEGKKAGRWAEKKRKKRKSHLSLHKQAHSQDNAQIGGSAGLFRTVHSVWWAKRRIGNKQIVSLLDFRCSSN